MIFLGWRSVAKILFDLSSDLEGLLSSTIVSLEGLLDSPLVILEGLLSSAMVNY